jgi:two-component system chemotaxis response regulator CheB
MGASAGGIEALLALLDELPADVPAALAVAIHRSPHFEGKLSAVLGRGARIEVREPTGPEPLRHGVLYVAPRDHHMVLEGERVTLHRGPKQHWMRPAVDPLFTSAAEAAGPRVVGVLLSGGGSDGVRGLVRIKRAGGLSVVQDPREARQPAMPIRAIADDDVDAVLGARRLGRAIVAVAHGQPFHAEQARPAPAPLR